MLNNKYLNRHWKAYLNGRVSGTFFLRAPEQQGGDGSNFIHCAKYYFPRKAAL